MKRIAFIFAAIFAFSTTSTGWSQSELSGVKQILSQEGYDLTAPAVVKIVSDAGSRIGAGVTVGMTIDTKTDDYIGFILTSYSMVAGRDKVAIILKNHSGGLLGHVVDKWIDFDLDVAIVAVKNFPPDQPVVTLGKVKSPKPGDVFTAITHTEGGDWVPEPAELNNADETHLTFNVDRSLSLEGAPAVNEDGHVIGLFISNNTIGTGDIPLASAVRSSVFKPILKEWFNSIKLTQKWEEQSLGIAPWMWAVGGGIVGGGVATALAISGGDDNSNRPLPVAPDPPPVPGQ